jgi:hypothetical protein
MESISGRIHGSDEAVLRSRTRTLGPGARRKVVRLGFLTFFISKSDCTIRQKTTGLHATGQSYHHARRRCPARYRWIRVERKPRRPYWSFDSCQELNSSTVSE